MFEGFDIFGSSRRRKEAPRKGADIQVDLELTLKESVFGCEKEIPIYRTEKCSVCGGSGVRPGATPVRCQKCGGTGQIRSRQATFFGEFTTIKHAMHVVELELSSRTLAENVVVLELLDVRGG